MLHKQLYFLISTPYYGNVGDHAIVLAEKEMLSRLGMKECMIDIDSFEYGFLKGLVISIINDNDIILIDGGGNFGDTWPETQERINDILKTFKNNRILIFPESWYFSKSFIGIHLLKETKEALENCKNVIIYARDGWSYKQMKSNLKEVDVRMAFDCVFYKDYTAKETIEKTVVGISLRGDRESTNEELKNSIIECLEEENIEYIIIHNDSYGHIRKGIRDKYFYNIISQYENSSIIITDRFHGLVFSIISRRPCLFYDNSTGKIVHFYNDIKGLVGGCVKASNNSFDKYEICRVLNNKTMSVDEKFIDNCNSYRDSIEKVLREWRLND